VQETRAKQPSRKRRRSTAQRRGGKQKLSPDIALVKALSHPLRARALAIANERVVSPKEISKELEVPLGHSSYHMKKLVEYDCIELVDTAQRRGATEHYYRGTTRSFLNDENWSLLEPNAKNGVSIAGLKMINDANRAAVEAGTFDSRDDRHLSCTPMDLDRPGWDEASGLFADTLEGMMQILERVAQRRADGETEDSVRTTASILFFESPPPTPSES
jgi:DNA-binding transcriptional ArsR family regulator